MTGIRLALAVIGLLLPGAAVAICDVTYKVQPGDTLASVASLHYGDAAQADRLQAANRDLLDDRDLEAGLDLYIPCARQEETAEPVTPPAARPEVGMRLLTGGNTTPFADHAWPESGLAVELVEAALAQTPYPLTHDILWEEERSLHLFPLLDEKRHDMGFPWVKPDCAATPDMPACARFHYSEPLMELPVMLFKRGDSDLTFTNDAGLAGRRLCRPSGHFTHDLDRAGRRWLSDGVIDLVQPETPEACFEALMAGEVDAVTLDVFLGAAKIVSMGLRGRVVPLDEPLSRETLHVVISKTHPRGTTHLYRINAGLAALRESGRYTEIVTRHLEIFWDRLK